MGACFIPWQPTEDFLGHDVSPGQKQVLRWHVLLRCPKDVRLEEGEEWFLKTRVSQVKRQRGLCAFLERPQLAMGRPSPHLGEHTSEVLAELARPD